MTAGGYLSSEQAGDIIRSGILEQFELNEGDVHGILVRYLKIAKGLLLTSSKDRGRFAAANEIIDDLYALSRWNTHSFIVRDRGVRLIALLLQDQIVQLRNALSKSEATAVQLIMRDGSAAVTAYVTEAEREMNTRSQAEVSASYSLTSPAIRETPVFPEGLNGVIREIERMIVFPFKNPGLAQVYNIRAGGGVLLYGPPGNGKTMIAKAIAGTIDAEFMNLTGTELVSMWRGGSEQAIAAAFDRARGIVLSGKRVVMFIDEVDNIAPRREDGGGDGASQANRSMVNELLTQLDGVGKDNSNILVLCATNAPWLLDPAFLRPGRIDRLLFVPLPDASAILSIMERQLEKMPKSPELSSALPQMAEELFAAGYSGAEISEIIKWAALSAFEQSIRVNLPDSSEGIVPITVNHLRSAIEATPPRTDPGIIQKLIRWGK